MNRILLIVQLLISSALLSAQDAFKVTYDFNQNYNGVISLGAEALTAEAAVIGGNFLSQPSAATVDGESVLQSTIINNNATNYNNTYLRLNIKAKAGYDVVITTVVATQSASQTGSSYKFRMGTNLNQAKPNTGDRSQSTDNIGFSSTLSAKTFVATSTYARAKWNDYATVWLCARGANTSNFNWNVDQIVVEGEYVLINSETSVDLALTQNTKQKLRLGIDAERLWYWQKGDYGNTLAELGVKDMRSEFVRVAVNCGYEIEEGVKKPDDYSKILDMMTAMKTANPDIKFFASPRPLDEAYSTAEAWEAWGASKAPWSPAPPWVVTWVENGTKTEDGVTVKKWKVGQVNVAKLTAYYADYLNLMHSQGFKIDFLDITNEFNSITATHCKYLYDNMPALLDEGVYMPELIAPSSWNYSQGVKYLNSFTTAQLSSFSIAASHNTNSAGSPEAFAAKAFELGKEPWESELHGWTGIAIEDEILNSSYFWDHLRAGFMGIDTWLFYGPKNGKDHTMLWSNSSSYTKSSKYEIFKKAVNEGNGGYYVDIIQPSTDNIHSAATLYNNTLMVWVLNKDKFSHPASTLDFGAWNVSGQSAEVTMYNASFPREGNVTVQPLTSSQLTFDMAPATVYAFKVSLLTSGVEPTEASIDVEIYPNPTEDFITVSLKNGTEVQWKLFDMMGRERAVGYFVGTSQINVSDYKVGTYVLKLMTTDAVTTEIISVK